LLLVFKEAFSWFIPVETWGLLVIGIYL